VEIEGVKGPRWLLTDELPRLRDPEVLDGTALLAPLDPLLWDRRLLRELFGFEYIWEIYTPPAKRKDGCYVLPVVHGDRIVGRLEPRIDRAAGALEIKMWRAEAGFRRRRSVLDEALERYRRFVGADRLFWSQ